MKITGYIPNTITSLNLLCGVLGIIFTFGGNLHAAFLLMLAAAVFDFCDGLSARALHAYSDMGKELDSLSDVVSFGVLPACMLHMTMRLCAFSNGLICYVPVILAVFSGIRLAKFNVDPRQSESFIGLATPASAMICGSLCYYVAHSPESFLSIWASGTVFIPVLSVALSLLLVSPIPMFSLKIKKGSPAKDNIKRLSFLANMLLICVIVIVLRVDWSMIVLFSLIVYVLMNMAFAIVEKCR